MLQSANLFLEAASARGIDLLARGFAHLTPWLQGLLGSWQPPGWLRAVGRLLAGVGSALQARLAWLLLAAAVGAGGWAVWPTLQKWTHGVTPEKVEVLPASASVVAPARTEIENNLGPNPVVLNFSRQVAPIAQVGKDALDVSIEPALEGRFSWVSATRLEFLPKEDWPLGVSYRIKLGRKAVAAHVKLDKTEFDFSSPRFTAQIDSGEFYQDPTQPNVRRAVFQVRFSHPVNTAEFEKKLTLSYDSGCAPSLLGLGGCASEKFSVAYDKYKLVATVQSEPLPIPEQTRAMTLRLAPGIVAQKSGPGSEGETQRSVDIPGLFNAEITSVSASIVTADNGEPEHVMHVAASMAVHEREMARMV
ncbi:MAG: alpha-2-macroglobulin family protein, partial [Rhodoferax sp.]|nr:alpha-2-macroglobulin family protein [Rhodoferax sp.]